MLIWLRTIVSCFCLVLCVLFAVLWVRSYFHVDGIYRLLQSQTTDAIETCLEPFVAQSGIGSIGIRYDYPEGPVVRSDHNPENIVWKLKSFDAGEAIAWLETDSRSFSRSVVRRTADYTIREVRFPHWFIVLTTGLLAILIRPKPRWRFGLRDLFTLTTVATFIVGLLAILLRSITA